MDFMIQIYNTKRLFVKKCKAAQSRVKKEKIAAEASNFKGSGTYVHLMDKTDILRDNTERNHFFVRFHAVYVHFMLQLLFPSRFDIIHSRKTFQYIPDTRRRKTV